MKRILMIALASVILAGCDNPKNTVDQVRQDIAVYKTDSSDALQAKIETGLAKLDGQIAKLQSNGKTAETADYRVTAENLRADYRTARMVHTIKTAQSAIQEIGTAFKETGKSIGDAFRDTTSPTPMSTP